MVTIYNVRLHANPEAGTGESWHLYTGPPAQIETIVKHYSELFNLIVEVGGRGADDSTDDPILQNWEAAEIIATDVGSGDIMSVTKTFFYSDSWEPYDNG